MAFTVLFVCTGNVCRSPAAELLLRDRLGPWSDIVVHSAGTDALVDDGIDHDSARALRDHGVDPGSHRARQLEPWMAAYADLVLTAEVAHRTTVMTDVPTAFRRTFTIREFASLCAVGLDGPLPDVVDHAARRRGLRGAQGPALDDIDDCYQAGPIAARTMVEAVATALDPLVRALSVGPARRARPQTSATPIRRPRPTAASRPRPGRRTPAPQAEPDRKT